MTIATTALKLSTSVIPAELHDEAEQSFEAVYLDPTQINFRYEGENLTLTMPDGSYFPRVTLRRCFPLSTNGMYVTVRTPDTEQDRGIEIGIINGIEKLTPESLGALSGELKLHYFVPVIKKVYKVYEEYGFITWKVLTDRGDKEFTMRDNVISTTRQISTTRWLLIDINQARYEINDDGTLDDRSRSLMIRHLLL
jgi:Domain of unknown function (DUF1854)